jgi:hypothetical protein
MRPVFFELTLWSDPQEWDVRPIFRDAAWGSSRVPVRYERTTPRPTAALAAARVPPCLTGVHALAPGDRAGGPAELTASPATDP